MTIRHLTGMFMAAIMLSASVAGAGPTVRVGQTPGGPQIMVDGKPIPPRMFWGSPGGGRVATTPEWTERSLEFATLRDVQGTGTLHFRFGHVPGQVWVADVRVV